MRITPLLAAAALLLAACQRAPEPVAFHAEGKPEKLSAWHVLESDGQRLTLNTGVLPYDTPAPSDLERLRRGDLIQSPRLRNPAIPVAIESIVLRALQPDVSLRYARAEDLLNDLLSVRHEPVVRRPVTPVAVGSSDAPRALRRPTPTPTPSRVRPLGAGSSRFCWQCRKPLPSKSARCPFCGEAQ